MKSKFSPNDQRPVEQKAKSTRTEQTVPSEGTWGGVHTLTEGSGSGTENRTRRRRVSGSYLQSAGLRRVTVMENSVEQSTLSIVGVLPRWAA